ncbi:hypothetical protein Q4595_26990, partial [Wenyingzhuangia sp. 1_MG-2023]|nr:hypothetical protein [Wenyingzhuangia sp. 1_MG-2023]
IDTWLPLQGIYFETGVVGQGGQAGDGRSVAGFENGVFDKAEAGFVRVADTKVTLGDKSDVAVGKVAVEQLGKFP